MVKISDTPMIMMWGFHDCFEQHGMVGITWCQSSCQGSKWQANSISWNTCSWALPLEISKLNVLSSPKHMGRLMQAPKSTEPAELLVDSLHPLM